MAEAHRRTSEVPYHGLRTKPFRENTDPAFLWLGPPYRDALSALRTAVLQNAGVLLLTAEVGMGKTMLARALADRLTAEGVRVAKLGHVALNPDEFRNGVARAFGVPAAGDTRETFAAGFGEFLRAAHALGEKVLLIVDEAQNLDAALLDEVGDLIRLGSEAAHGAVNGLNILLVAQPSIDTLLRRRKSASGGDFVAVRAHLRPLDVAQVADYVAFRLRAAGAERELFSVDAIGEVASMSGGVPRLINQICDRTLVITSPWNGCMVSAGVVRGALRDVDTATVRPARRLLAGSGIKRVVYAVSVALVAVAIGLGTFLYYGGRTPSVAHAPARPEARPPVATEPATPSAPAATEAAATAPLATAPPATAPTTGAPAAPATDAPAPSAVSDRAAGDGPVDKSVSTRPTRTTTAPAAQRGDTGRMERARAVKPRAEAVTPPRPAREQASDVAPPPRTGGSDSEDPSAIIDWMLQRNPAAGR